MYTKRNYNYLPKTFGGLLDEAINSGLNKMSEELVTYAPPVNILETDKQFEIHVMLPGVKKEDFQISIEKNVLTVNCPVNQTPQDESSGKWIRTEFRPKTFKRSFALPEHVDLTNIKANYESGILLVTIPKKTASTEETITVKVN